MQFSLSTVVVALAVFVGTAIGETHTVHLQNNCLRGTPTLIVGNTSQGPSADVSTDIVFNGPVTNGVAFLQTGDCGSAGEHCTAVHFSLVNGDEAAAQSSANVNLDLPYSFSIPSGFSFTNGCDGVGANCSNEECSAASVVVNCLENDVDLTITFCGSVAA